MHGPRTESKLGRVDAERACQGRQELLRLLIAGAIIAARLHVVDFQAGADEELADARSREKTQVCPVEQALLLVVPLAAQQAEKDAPVLHVGDTGEDLAIGPQPTDVALHDGPGVAQVLEHITVDQAID